MNSLVVSLNCSRKAKSFFGVKYRVRRSAKVWIKLYGAWLRAAWMEPIRAFSLRVRQPPPPPLEWI